MQLSYLCMRKTELDRYLVLTINKSLFYGLIDAGTMQSLIVNNTATNGVNSVKFLRLNIVDSLKWDFWDIDSLSKKRYCLFRIKVSFQRAKPVHHCYALFESYLWYALPFWGACGANQFQGIFIITKNSCLIFARTEQ